MHGKFDQQPQLWLFGVLTLVNSVDGPWQALYIAFAWIVHFCARKPFLNIESPVRCRGFVVQQNITVYRRPGREKLPFLLCGRCCG